MNQYLWTKKTFAFTVRVPNSQETYKREVEHHLKLGLDSSSVSHPSQFASRQTKKCSAADPNSLMLFLQYHRLWVEHVVNRDMLWHHCLVWTIVCLLQESTPTVPSASFCAANHGVHPEYTGSLKTALWEYHVKHVSPFWDVEYILMCTSMSHAQDLQYTHVDKRKIPIRALCSSCLVMFLFTGTNALHFN